MSSLLMNSTELSREFQSTIILVQHITGASTFIFNAFVCILIFLDSDPRGKAYRKYVFCLQFCSTLADIFLSIYSPIYQLNCRVIYADSNLACVIRGVNALIIYMAGFAETIVLYFACVYFRRNTLLPRGTRFCFYGWKYVVTLTAVQVFTIIAIGVLYYAITSLEASIEEIPSTVDWVTLKPTFLVISGTRFNYPAMIFAILSEVLIAILVFPMIAQLTAEIKNGMTKASPATKRYQTRAVLSLRMQGAVPSLFYAVPVLGEIGIYAYTLFVSSEEAANNRTVSSLSALACNTMSLHTFVHSLTILACSPSYRKTILSLIEKISSTTTRTAFGERITVDQVKFFDLKKGTTVISRF